MGNIIGDMFKFQLPDDCSCKYSDAQKTAMLISWCVAASITIILTIWYTVSGIKLLYYLLWLLYLVLVGLSVVLYFDGCSCKETEYSKFFSFGYIVLSIVIIYVCSKVSTRTYNKVEKFGSKSINRSITNEDTEQTTSQISSNDILASKRFGLITREEAAKKIKEANIQHSPDIQSVKQRDPTRTKLQQTVNPEPSVNPQEDINTAIPAAPEL